MGETFECERVLHRKIMKVRYNKRTACKVVKASRFKFHILGRGELLIDFRSTMKARDILTFV